MQHIHVHGYAARNVIFLAPILDVFNDLFLNFQILAQTARKAVCYALKIFFKCISITLRVCKNNGLKGAFILCPARLLSPENPFDYAPCSGNIDLIRYKMTFLVFAGQYIEHMFMYQVTVLV